MSRLTASILIALLWAGIYLPGLGSIEIKGEEGRRILPAATMLDTGEWIVPYVGGKPYLRKPPLVNWLIAGSFHLTGLRNEWAARLPSVLSLLALGLITVMVVADAKTGFLAAFFVLTSIGLIEKGRLAEIEALYVSLSGIAIVCWMSWWSQKRSPWLLWILPGFFLGLGLLTKGPLHLLFYYALVVAVLWRAGELRRLLHPAHWLGLALMLGVFALWAVPYFSKASTLNAAQVWGAQFAGRVSGQFDLVGWLTNIPRGLLNLMPWTLMLPMLWKKLPRESQRLELLFKSTRLAVSCCFLGLLLLPGVLPRYTLPLLPALGWLLADAIQQDSRCRELWGRPLFFCKSNEAVKLALHSGAIIVALMLGYWLLVIPQVVKRDDLRPLAKQIEQAVPPGESLHLFDAGYMPVIFYLKVPYVYAEKLRETAPRSKLVLAREQALKKVIKQVASHQQLAQWSTPKGERFFLVRVESGN